MRRPGGSRNSERQGRGQGQQGSSMGPPGGPGMGYQQPHQYHHHHQHHHHTHHHHHNSSYNNVYDGARPPPHAMQPMPPHNYGQGVGGAGGGNGWNTPQQPPPQQQVSMYNQGYSPMGPAGYTPEMGPGVYPPEMHGGQYPPSPSHMGAGAGMPFMRGGPMHGGGVPPNGGGGPYGGGMPGPGSPLPMGYGRGGQPPMEAMGPGGSIYGAPMGRHDGYGDSRLSPPPQVVGGGYGANMGGPPPPLPGMPPYSGMPSSRSPAGPGYQDPRGRGMMNTPLPMTNPGRNPRVGSPDPGMIGGGVPPSGRFNQQPPMMSPAMIPPSNYIPGGNLPPSQMTLMPSQIDHSDLSNIDPYDTNEQNYGLLEFLQDRELVSVGNLSSFFPEGYDPKNDPPLTIAIDGNWCLTSLYDELRKKDPLCFLHSILPEELLVLVSRHVNSLRSSNLEPIWVFNGLNVSGDVEAFLSTEPELRSRDVIWSKLEEGELPNEDEIKSAFDPPLGEDVQMAVVRYLKKLNVVAVTAPFLNWAQMVAFHHEGFAHILMGPPEMLLLQYDKMKFILQIDVSSNNVYFFDRDRVLRTLFPYHVTETSTTEAGDRLMDFGLLTAKHPALSSVRVTLDISMKEIYEELSAKDPDFRSIKDFINAHASLEDSNKKKPGLNIKHSKGRGYLRYCTAFSSQLSDSPLLYLARILDPKLTNEDMPSNLNGVLGHFAPLSLFYFQFAGLLPVHIMTVITQSYLRDECPVSDTKDYHDKLEVLVSMRSQIIAQIFKKIAQDKYSKRTECISWVRWFEPILAPMHRPRELIDLDEWNISDSEELRQLDENHLEDYSIATVLTFSGEAIRPIRENDYSSNNEVPILYHGKKETLFAILLKSLDFLGYFSHTSCTPEFCGEEMGELMNNTGNMIIADAAAASDSNNYNYNNNYNDYNNNNNNMERNDQMNDDGLIDPNNFERNDQMMGDGMNDCAAVCFPYYLMNTIKHNQPSFQDAFVILTELLRVGIIGSLPCQYIDPENQQQAIPMEDQEANCDPRVLLASRIACLVTVPYHRPSEDSPFVWAPVYSRHLCAFTVMVRSMCRCLRELVEVIATAVFLSRTSSCSLTEFAELSQLLPFGGVPSAIGGLLLHYVLVFPADYQVDLTTRQQRVDYLQQKFRDIPNIGEHLRRVMSFTLQALYLINAYKLRDKGAVVPMDLLQSNTVEATIELLWEKWGDHIGEAPPRDIHNLYDCWANTGGEGEGGEYNNEGM